jgi:hypothetical protein
MENGVITQLFKKTKNPKVFIGTRDSSKRLVMPKER